MKKTAWTMVALFALSNAVMAFADDTAKNENKSETKVDTSHSITGKETTTKKHKRHHKNKNADGSVTTKDTTTTEKSTAPDNK